MRSSKKTFTALVALALGSAGFAAGPAALSATAAGPVSLSQAFDNVGITAASGSALGNLDGTGDSFAAASLANWVSTSASAAPSGGESDLLATTGGWNPGGSLPVSLSYLSVPVSPAKTVASVTLPAVGATVGHDVPALHVFDLAVGTVASRATDGPGALSYYDLARKDCVGTAPSTASKAWYTVAGGMLSDVYYPTIDNTNSRSLQYVVTDGSTFTDIQPRDMTYTVSALGSAQMACEVTATAKNGSYKIVTDYLTDPGRSAVVMRVSFDPLTAGGAADHLYARLQPLVNGHGGGGSQNAGADSATTVSTSDGAVPVDYSTNSFTEAVNRTFATPVYLALAASRPFPATDNGYAGQPSDGLTQLSLGHQLTSSYQNASDGDVTTTVEVPGTGPGHQASARDATTLVLGFGQTEDAATSTALASARTPFAATLGSYEAQWQRYDATLKTPPAAISGVPAAEMAKGAGRLLAQRECDQGQPGQAVRRRGRRRPGQPVGPGGPGRERGEWARTVLRLLPGDVLPGRVRDVHRLPDGRRPGRRAGHRPVPVRPAAAGQRGAAA